MPLAQLSENDFKPIQEKFMPGLVERLKVLLKDPFIVLNIENIILRNGDNEIKILKHNLIPEFNTLKPITQHRIRDFVNRRYRKEQKTNQNNNDDYSNTSVNFHDSQKADRIDIDKLLRNYIKIFPSHDVQHDIVNTLHKNNELVIIDDYTFYLDFENISKKCLIEIEYLVHEKYEHLVNCKFDIEELVQLRKNLDVIAVNEFMNDRIFDIVYGDTDEVNNEDNRDSEFVLDLISINEEKIIKLEEFINSLVKRASNNDVKLRLRPSEIGAKLAIERSIKNKDQISYDIMELKHLESESNSIILQNGVFDKRKIKFIKYQLANQSNISKAVNIIYESEKVFSQTINLKELQNSTLERLYDYFKSRN